MLLQNNILILSTRPLNESLISKTAERGIDITCIPFIKTQTLATPEIVEKIQEVALQKFHVIFTSVNGVESVIQHLHKKPDWKIFCIGGATKDMAFTFFDKEQVIATGKNATVLSQKIIASGCKEVIFFCGDQRLNEIPETLQAHHIKVNELIVYTTVQTPQTIDQNFKGILFFSPSAVHSFFSVNTIPLDVVLFAIGKTTAATIESYCTNKIIVSDWPGQDSIIDKVLEYFEGET